MQSVLLANDAALNKPTAVVNQCLSLVCVCVQSWCCLTFERVTVLWENFQHCRCFCSEMEEPNFNMNWPDIPFQGWLDLNSVSLMTPITTFCLALHSNSTSRSLIGHFHAPVVTPTPIVPGFVNLSVLLVFPPPLASNQLVKG